MRCYTGSGCSGSKSEQQERSHNNAQPYFFPSWHLIENYFPGATFSFLFLSFQSRRNEQKKTENALLHTSYKICADTRSHRASKSILSDSTVVRERGSDHQILSTWNIFCRSSRAASCVWETKLQVPLKLISKALQQAGKTHALTWKLGLCRVCCSFFIRIQSVSEQEIKHILNLTCGLYREVRVTGKRERWDISEQEGPIRYSLVLYCRSRVSIKTLEKAQISAVQWSASIPWSLVQDPWTHTYRPWEVQKKDKHWRDLSGVLGVVWALSSVEGVYINL